MFTSTSRYTFRRSFTGCSGDEALERTFPLSGSTIRTWPLPRAAAITLKPSRSSAAECALSIRHFRSRFISPPVPRRRMTIWHRHPAALARERELPALLRTRRSHLEVDRELAGRGVELDADRRTGSDAHAPSLTSRPGAPRGLRASSHVTLTPSSSAYRGAQKLLQATDRILPRDLHRALRRGRRHPRRGVCVDVARRARPSVDAHRTLAGGWPGTGAAAYPRCSQCEHAHEVTRRVQHRDAAAAVEVAASPIRRDSPRTSSPDRGALAVVHNVQCGRSEALGSERRQPSIEGTVVTAVSTVLLARR